MMGKQSGKKKKQAGTKSGNTSTKESKVRNNSPKPYDEDTAVFISMSGELKYEGNKLFQKRDYEGAMLKYEKAIKLLPRNHIDVSYLRSNMAACHMQMGISEYPRAIHECNLALEVTPKYSKALLKRARCYEALNRLDFALRDVSMVLKLEPNNIMATEIAERVRTTIERRSIKANEIQIDSVPEYIEPPCTSHPPKVLKENPRKKKNKKFDRAEDKTEEEKAEDRVEESVEEQTNEKKAKDKFEEKEEAQTDNKKAEENVENNKAEGENKAEDELAEDKVEEQKAEERTDENKAEDKLTENRVEDKKAEERTDESKAEDKLAEDTVEEKKAEERTDKRKDKDQVELAEDKVEEQKAEERTDENKAEDEVTEDKVEVQKAEERTDENKAEDKLGEDIVEEKKAEERINKREDKDQVEEKNSEEKTDEKKAEDKVFVEEKTSTLIEEEPKRTVKLVFGEDIRWAQLPFNCTILKLREVICDRFPSSKAVLVKYRDQEGDLVTITTDEELRWAEASSEQQGSVRLYVVEVNPEQDPFYDKVKREEEVHKPNIKHSNITENGSMENGNNTEMGSSCIDDWVIQFAQLFKNYVGFSSDAYLDLHDMGMKLYSEALEETVTSEEAQDLFQTAAENFQEMAALALFNCGNVHMSRARKRVYFTEDASTESILAQVATAYHWAQEEFLKAGNRYEEALKMKPDFFEAVLALGQQQFEQAKLSWYYAVGSNVDLETWPTAAVLQLYNNAEDNMERGMQMWEEAEEQRMNELSKPNTVKTVVKTSGLDGLYKDISAEEAAEQAANMRSQINLLWGTMLYERSAMEFKLGLPVWHECLEIAVEKFELAGASPTDIAVMIKNHCSNDTSLQGLGFNIDEIVQAWNEMYEAKRWQSGVPSFRLEPLLRRRVSKLYYALVHA